MGWQTPVTNWLAGDGIKASDFNRIEKNIWALHADTINVSAVWSGENVRYTADSYITVVSRAVAVPAGKKIRLLELALSYANNVQGSLQSDDAKFRVVFGAEALPTPLPNDTPLASGNPGAGVWLGL